MRCPTLQQIPPPPAGKTGWPWIVVPEKFPELTPSGKPWPKISIVTPSYNQGQFLEETIRSVLLQGYPNLEYIIMDGGSTDESVEIIKKYEPWLTSWVSEKDNGQADAIYRGFEKATGEIIGWLNSDDYLLPEALKTVGKVFAGDKELELIIGGGIIVDEHSKLLEKRYSFPQDFSSLMSIAQMFMQMSSFWRRSAYFEMGGLDTSLRFAFDYDLFLRLARRRDPLGLNEHLSAFRLHRDSKTCNIFATVGLSEIEMIRKRYLSELITIETCKNNAPRYTRQYHLNKRYGILKDILRDPPYFARCARKKIFG